MKSCFYFHIYYCSVSIATWDSNTPRQSCSTTTTQWEERGSMGKTCWQIDWGNNLSDHWTGKSLQQHCWLGSYLSFINWRLNKCVYNTWQAGLKTSGPALILFTTGTDHLTFITVQKAQNELTATNTAL